MSVPMQEQRGIPEVFQSFPAKFKRVCKGRGHEVTAILTHSLKILMRCSYSHCLQAGDLGRILQMYHTWQRGLFPHIPFDTFLLELEKIGATHTMKAGPILDLLHEASCRWTKHTWSA